MTREEYIGFANALKNNYTIDFDKLPEFCDMAISTLKEKSTDEVVQKIRTAIGVNLYEIAGKFNESYGDAAIYLQELIDKAVSE